MGQKLTGTKMCVGLFLVAASLLLTARATGAISIVIFSGELQRVTAGSISIRLTDGRIIEARNTATRGDLSPRNLAERYTVGDQVEIGCIAIGGVYYPLIGRRLSLELKKLRFFREPSKDERSKALTSKAWRQSPNLLRVAPPLQPVPGESLPGSLQSANDNEPATGPTSEWPVRLEQIRSHILKFVSGMPNFVADEVAQRYVSTTSPPNWRLVDTIESEITFKGSAVSRDHIVVSGKPWNAGYRALPGFKWTDAFGSQLTYLFDPTCPTTFEPEGRVSEGGKSLSAVRYSSPPDGCEFFWQDYQQFYPGKTGRILLDEREENVIRFETNSQVFPKAFPISASEKQVSWDFVRIGDATHLLPVSADITIVLSTGEMKLARHEYKNHRHFEAASTITFH
jgi:hypothetical protein